MLREDLAIAECDLLLIMLSLNPVVHSLFLGKRGKGAGFTGLFFFGSFRHVDNNCILNNIIMTFGVKRIVVRQENTLVLRKDAGLFLYDKNKKTFNSLGHSDSKLLDFTKDGSVAVINGGELLIKGNANRTSLKFLNTNSNKKIFETTKFWAFRAITDTTSSKVLVEHSSGLTCLTLNNGEIIFDKKRIEVYLCNSDILVSKNLVYMPSNKKSLRLFDFNNLTLDEIKIKTRGKTENLKILNDENKILISDSANIMYCYSLDNFEKPDWIIDFSKFDKPFSRVWCYNIYRIDKELACVQSFLPNENQHNYAGGKLWIFNPLTGVIVDSYDYSNFNQEIASEYGKTSILLDDLREFDLIKKTITKSEFT